MPEHQREMLSLVTARVRDAFVRKPFYLDGTTDLVSACRELSRHGQTSALVRDGERLGIFTTTDLRDALLRPEPPAALPVKAVARFDIVSVDADSELFEALWLMVRHRVHRLVVREGERVVGLLGQLDLVSFVANHSHIVALQIEEAETEDQLAEAAARIDQMVSLLHGSGIRIERVARLVARGMSNKGIAAELGVSEVAVKTQVSAALDRIGLVDRVGLTLWVIRERLALPVD